MTQETKKVLFGVLVVSFIFFGAASVEAITSCPFGYVDDPYPGLCARYIDENNNNYCDHSQVDSIALNYNQSEIESQETANDLAEKGGVKTNYYFWQIIILITLLYFFGQYLILLSKETKIKWLKGITQIRVQIVFNVILLISFIFSLFTALLRLAHLFGWFVVSLKILYWHVEFSIVLATLSVIHILKNWQYFKRIFFK